MYVTVTFEGMILDILEYSDDVTEDIYLEDVQEVINQYVESQQGYYISDEEGNCIED